MHTAKAKVEEYLERFREGDAEEAFFRLIEMDSKIIPELVAAFQGEPNSEVRRFLVEVIWQHRQSSTVAFLREALNDPDPAVWKEAIDGLVTLGSPEAIAALEAAKGREFPTHFEATDFRSWIDEAIQQVQENRTSE